MQVEEPVGQADSAFSGPQSHSGLNRIGSTILHFSRWGYLIGLPCLHGLHIPYLFSSTTYVLTYLLHLYSLESSLNIIQWIYPHPLIICFSLSRFFSLQSFIHASPQTNHAPYTQLTVQNPPHSFFLSLIILQLVLFSSSRTYSLIFLVLCKLSTYSYK